MTICFARYFRCRPNGGIADSEGFDYHRENASWRHLQQMANRPKDGPFGDAKQREHTLVGGCQSWARGNGPG